MVILRSQTEDSETATFVLGGFVLVLLAKQAGDTEGTPLDPQLSGLRDCRECCHPAICAGHDRGRIIRVRDRAGIRLELSVEEGVEVRFESVSTASNVHGCSLRKESIGSSTSSMFS